MHGRRASRFSAHRFSAATTARLGGATFLSPERKDSGESLSATLGDDFDAELSGGEGGFVDFD